MREGGAANNVAAVVGGARDEARMPAMVALVSEFRFRARFDGAWERRGGGGTGCRRGDRLGELGAD